jgi:hypothetical protein
VEHVSEPRSNRNGRQAQGNSNSNGSARARRKASKRRNKLVAGSLESLENRRLLSVTGFQPAVNYNASAAPRAVAIGDLNGDGKLDLVVANQTGANVSVLLGNGNGTFQSAVNYAAGTGPRAVVLGDFNGDGKLDIAVANQNGLVNVLLGNGSGGFSAPVSYSAGSTPVALTTGDFNGDGKLDLAVANFAGNNVSILTGKGDGTFNSAVNYNTTTGSTGTAPDGIVAGDFNGDGHLDIATSDSGGGISVLLNNGSGGFGAPSTFSAGTSPKGIVAADFTGDGKLDLAVINGTSNNISLLTGNGAGSFSGPTNFSVGTSPIGATAGDFNSDGKEDLAVVNSGGNNVTMLYGNGNGTFNTGVNQAVATNPQAVAAGDFNGDGSIDLAVANKDSNNVSVLLDKHITVTGADQAGNEGVAFSGITIASFSDTESGSVAGDYSATINWGDGSSSAGVVAANGGHFDVTASHTYAEFGVYTATITVHDTLGTTASSTASITVNDAALHNGNVVTATATEGAAFNGTVANFTDDNTGASAGDFVAVIDWGDGTSSGGTIVSDGAGAFHVTGTHTWHHNSSPTITIDVLDNGGSETVVSTAATVNDAPLTPSAAAPVFVEGTGASQTIATFTDANPYGSVGEFSATITWGDGSSSAGTVVANGSGGYDVQGTHTYLHSGNKAASVAITSTGGSTANQNVTAAVNNAALTILTQNDVTITEGIPFSHALVATFKDANTSSSAADFSATIDWGDGTTTAAVVEDGGQGGFYVYSSNVGKTYAHAGTKTIQVAITGAGGGTLNTTSHAHVVNQAINAVANALTTTEGTVLPGTTVVGTFTDANNLASAADFTATINWGDGTTTSATIAANGGGGFDIMGGHTYAHAGNKTLSVTVNGAGGGTSSSSHAVTVNNAAITTTATAINPVEGSSFSGQVAHFTDANTLASAGDFTASINWGDGATTAGTVVANAGGGFDVNGTHTYTEEGAPNVTVTITGAGGGTSNDTAAATVNDATLHSTGHNVTATEATLSGSLTVATFTDDNPNADINDFVAVIDWGDGNISVGTITANGSGGYDVTDSHRYLEAGDHTLTVTIDDAGGAETIASSTAHVDYANITVSAGSFTATEGVSASGTVASFVSDNGSALAGEYTALIDWGDGTTSAGAIADNHVGGFDVTGSHTYAHAGNKPVGVTISGSYGPLGNTSLTATVPNAAMAAAASGFTATEGTTTSSSTIVAHFTDANASASASDFTASIAWGDGTTAPGTVVAHLGGGFDVQAGHSYAHAGNKTFTVTVTGAGGGTASDSATATVNNAALASTGHDISGTEGQAITTPLVASFTDANAGATASDFTAQIHWGDGSSSAGTVAANGSGGFDITGPNHTYAHAGNKTITVDITGAGGGTTEATATAIVANDTITVTAQAVSATEGTSTGSVLIATFTDANASASAGDFTASIDWGDGTTSSGTIAANGGHFDVTAAHTWAHAGGKTVTVTITGAGGGTGSDSHAATVANAAMAASASGFTATEGTATSSNTLVAHFTDANASATAGDFTASIDWGDGTTSAGTVVAHLGGGFDVQGGHSYAHAGSKTFTVTVTGAGGGTASDTGTATVNNATLASAGVDISGVEGSAITAPLVATFTDSNAGASAADFTGTIDWGDGSSDVAVISANGSGGFDVTGPDHTYAHAGDKTITVDITGAGGGTTEATATATVDNAALASSANDLTAVEGTAIPANTLIGTFTDANALASAGDFTAMIWWGDGVHTPGTITKNVGGWFDVKAGHTYDHAGAFPITMSIQGAAIGATGAVATARIANDAITVTAQPFAATEGQPMTNALVATFTDANATATADNFYAVIAWGDGTIGAGTIAANQSGGFDVTGTHIYAHSGNKSATVTIYGKGGGVLATDQANDIQVNGNASYDNGGLQLTDGGNDEAGSAWTTNFLDVTGFHTHFRFQLPTSDADGFTFAIQNDNSLAALGAVGGSLGYEGINHSIGVAFNMYPGVSVTGLYVNGQSPHGNEIDMAASGIDLHSGHTFGVTFDYDGTTLTQTVVDEVTGATFTHAYAIDIPGTIGASTGFVGFTGATGGATSTQHILDWVYTTGTPQSDSHVGTVANQTISASAVDQSAVEGIATNPSIVATFTDPNALASAGDFTATIDWGDGSAPDNAAVSSDGSGGFIVTAPAHTYLHAGDNTATVVITGAGGGTATVHPAVAVANNTLAATGQNISATEGTSSGSVVVANFTDANAAAVAGDFTATIAWGDGSSSAATIASDGAGGFNVTGTHTYDHAGDKTISVTVNGAGGGTASASSTATVDNAALTPTGGTFTATEAASFTGIVGHFSDANGAAGASDFTATIDWGDGHTSVGTIVASNGGGFDITGTHTYDEEGTYNVASTATGLGGGTVESDYTGTVNDAALSASASNITATEGTATATLVVASFTDADPNGTLADYTATIDWGDGSSSAGTIASDGQGGWTVSGSHLYATAGAFTVATTVNDAGGATANASGSATVSHGILTAAANNISGTEGTAIAGTTVVAHFTDTNASAVAGDFTATIDWGDGSSSAGTVVANGGGGFDVQAGHTYAHAGDKTFTVSVSGVGGSDSKTATATIDNAALAATAVGFTATEGTATGSSTLVAHFTDANASASATDFTATIDWGDGATSAGTVVANGGGGFDVQAGHSYAHAGNKTFAVTITGAGGGTASDSGTATVNNAALTPTGTTISGTEGTAIVGAITGHFDDANAGASAADFTATINWGDGTTSAGTVVANAGGGFDVTATHTYAHAGPKTLTVDVTGAGGGTTTITSSATVANAALALTGNTVTATEAASFTGAVVSFTDANASASAGDFTAVIDWNDGSGTSAGTIAANGSGGFDVSGTHTYIHAGPKHPTATVVGLGGGSVVGNGTVNVGNATLSSSGQVNTAVEGTAFSGTLGSFTDSNAAAVAGDFTATIDWNDGTTTSATIAPKVGGGFTVSGSHTYTVPGAYSPAFTVTGAGGGTTVGTSLMAVTDATLNPSAVTIHATEGSAFSGQVASFQDQNHGSVAGDFTATIDWGDGSSSAGTLVAQGNGLYTITGTHTWTSAGNRSVAVTINDTGGANASVTSTAIVGDATLTATGHNINPVEGTSTGTVSVMSFTDANPLAVAGDFTATITWGDGASAAGTVVANGSGGFDVTGAHTYAHAGNRSVSVVVNDVGGATASAGVTATVANAQLDIAAGSVSGTEGTPIIAIVAHFTDANDLASATDFAATINWGDGTTTVGAVSDSVSGGFDILGSHTYRHAGSKTVTVTVNGQGGGSVSTTLTAPVANAALASTGKTGNATEGISATLTLASFTDANSFAVAADFAATIDWGDGSTSAGLIAANGSGGFDVSGTHTYDHAGSKSPIVTITGAGGGTTQATATVTVDNANLSATGQDVSAVEGASTGTVTVASFTDDNAAASADDFTATIHWGDGTSSAAAIAADDEGGFQVNGTHTYAHAGSKLITIDITGAGGGTAQAMATANVANDTLTASSSTLNATEGTAMSNVVVAHFTDANAAASASDFAATIDWGDGVTSDGVIVANQSGGFDVTGTHTYAHGGDEFAAVSITGNGGGSASTNFTVHVHNDTITVTGKTLSIVEGSDFSGVVATFTDANPLADAIYFDAHITWGDGSSSDGAVSANGSGGFDVTADHTYATAGPGTVTIQIVGSGGSTVSGTSSMNVTDAALSATGTTVSATEGTALAGGTVLATLTDANTLDTASSFTATINWGDGSAASAATIVSTDAGAYTITGPAHTYLHGGAKTVAITIHDAGGSIATATTTVNVANATLAASMMPINGVSEGTPFTGKVGHFTDANASASVGDFTAQITWGDGSTTVGTVSANAGGGFDVAGSHTWTTGGVKPISVAITGSGGGNANANGNVAIGLKPIKGSGSGQTVYAGTPFTANVASFTDKNTDSVAGDFTATIHWGDGTSSTGTITKVGTKFVVTATHTYPTNGKFSTLITIADVDGATITVHPSMTVRKPKVGKGHGHGHGHGKGSHGSQGVGAGNPGSQGGSSAPTGGAWTKADQIAHGA